MRFVLTKFDFLNDLLSFSPLRKNKKRKTKATKAED